MEFFEAPIFARYVSGYLTDDEYREMQGRLASAPEAGDMIPGTGAEDFESFVGRTQSEERDKEAAYGLIYYYFPAERKIWLMTLYAKNEASDLTPKERQALKSAIEDELRVRQTAKLRKQRKSRR